MSSRDNTAANIPAITDQMLEELEESGGRSPENTAAKDKIISDLVAHVKKQHKVIRNLNDKLQPAEQWDIQQADIFAEFIEKDAHYHNLDSNAKDNLISRLSDHIREKQQELACNVERAERFNTSFKEPIKSDSSSPKLANADIVDLKANAESSLSSQQRREIEDSIKKELMSQIKDDLRKELLDEIGKQYPKSDTFGKSHSGKISDTLSELAKTHPAQRKNDDKNADEKTVKVNVGLGKIRNALLKKEARTAEPKIAESKASDPKTAELKRAEIKNAEIKSPEIKSAEIKSAEINLTSEFRVARKPTNADAKKTHAARSALTLQDENVLEAQAKKTAKTLTPGENLSDTSDTSARKVREKPVSAMQEKSVPTANMNSEQQGVGTLETTPFVTENQHKQEVVWPVRGAVVIENDEDDEEDEYDIDKTLDNEALYSLTEKLGVSKDVGVVDHTAPTLIEVTRFHRGEITALEHVAVGSSYSVDVGAKKVKIAANGKNNQCQVFYQQRFFSGGIGESRNGSREPENVKNLKAKNPNKSLRYALPPDKIVFLKAGNDEYRLRVVPTRVACEVAEEKPEQGKRFRHFLQYSAGFHLLIILVGSLVYALTHQKVEVKEEPRFAQVDLQQLNPVTPTPVPKPPKPKKVAEVKVKEPDPKQKIKVTKKPAAAKPTPKNAGGGSKDGGNIKKRDVKSSGLLAALGSKKGKTPGKKQTLAAVSSIDAVSSLNQDSAVLKVGGLAAKVKGTRIEVASGELINTQGSSKVLRSGGVAGEGQVGALESGITGNRDVRGRVSATLTRTVKIQGGLSRDEVKSVIDAHMDEVVYCYEKTLLTNAGLAGKAVFEWKVLMSGRVGEVNIKSSSLRSSEIHSCIKSAVKSWQFPKPTGASVFVSFPFIFDSVSF